MNMKHLSKLEIIIPLEDTTQTTALKEHVCQCDLSGLCVSDKKILNSSAQYTYFISIKINTKSIGKSWPLY